MVPTLYQRQGSIRKNTEAFQKHDSSYAIISLPYQERLSKTGLWTLEDRHVRADLIEVYKIIHGVLSVSFDTCFELSHNSITRGHPLNVQKRKVCTDLFQHFFLQSELLIFGTHWMKNLFLLFL